MASIRKQEDELVALLKSRRNYIKPVGSIVVGLFFVAIGVHFLFAGHAATPAISVEPETGNISGPAVSVTDPTASKGGAVKFGSSVNGNCAVTAILTNPCHPWLGGESSNYPNVPNNPKDQDLQQESRIGRQLQMVHTYHPPGSNSLTASDLYFINRPNTILEADWIPGNTGTFAGDGSASNNANIDKMAASIKAVAPHQIILSLWHEPENDADTGMSPCTPAGKGHAGSPAQFAAMFRYIHDRFAADGVSNVVWAINYMGATNWDKCINQFWPGNSYVDWIFWDPYSHDGNFDNMVGRFYNVLTANTDATHDYTSKAWGIAEWNIYWSGETLQNQVNLYTTAKTVVESNKYPRMKAYEVFDSLDQSIFCYPKTDKNLNPPLINASLLASYKAYANSGAFSNP